MTKSNINYLSLGTSSTNNFITNGDSAGAVYNVMVKTGTIASTGIYACRTPTFQAWACCRGLCSALQQMEYAAPLAYYIIYLIFKYTVYSIPAQLGVKDIIPMQEDMHLHKWLSILWPSMYRKLCHKLMFQCFGRSRYYLQLRQV
jgi:hypothetical protein